MSDFPTRLEVEDLQQNLQAMQESLARAREPAELRATLDKLHPADVAYILEALPLEERLVVWELVRAELSYLFKPPKGERSSGRASQTAFLGRNY